MSREAKKNILVQNIYHMMAYAFGSVTINDYRKLELESFDGVCDLMAAILACGISAQRKRGLEKAYLGLKDNLVEPRGKICFTETINRRVRNDKRVNCRFDDYSENTFENQILKFTAKTLLRADILPKRKHELKQCIICLGCVDDLVSPRIDWHRLRNKRMSPSYRLLMNVCYLVHNDLLMVDAEGQYDFADIFNREHFAALYESFLLAYFKKHHSDLRPNADMVDAHISGDAPSFLPKMYTDITLHAGNHVLIIDAKCYGQILRNYYDKERISNANRYQIYSYVIHKSFQSSDVVSGMLLYAKTKQEQDIDETWYETGHVFTCKTLSLDCDFEEIATMLDNIACSLRDSNDGSKNDRD